MDRDEILHKLNPYVRRAMFLKTRKFVLKPRIIFDYELIYLAKGEIEAVIDGSRTTHKPGDIILIRPGIEHSLNCLGDGETWMPHIHFDVLNYDDYRSVPINFKNLSECCSEEIGMIREDILGPTGLGFPDIIRISNHEEVFRLIQTLADRYNPDKPGNLLIQKAIALEILDALIRGLESGSSSLNNLKNLEKASAYIAKHFNETIPNDVLAKQCCLSVSHFRKLFSRHYRVSPVQYQVRIKIEHAKELLIYSYMSLMEIAERVGYENVHAFSKAFKKNELISPGEYRTKHRGENNRIG